MQRMLKIISYIKRFGSVGKLNYTNRRANRCSALQCSSTRSTGFGNGDSFRLEIVNRVGQMHLQCYATVNRSADGVRV